MIIYISTKMSFCNNSTYYVTASPLLAGIWEMACCSKIVETGVRCSEIKQMKIRVQNNPAEGGILCCASLASILSSQPDGSGSLSTCHTLQGIASA